ncbi:MAG: FHA domain-containing protein, partial [Pseudomonadales bacterium]|nr:FHA domain-containing protein [Pseudomonadales bacterium]
MTLKIIVIREDKPIEQVLMEQHKLVIGRRAECDIPIKDPAVSGSHAEIEFVGNGYILRDLGSTNGVHVRGRQIKEHALKHEDLITIGEHQLRILITDNNPPSKQAPEKPVTEALNRDVTEVRSVPVTNEVDGYLKYVQGGDPG